MLPYVGIAWYVLKTDKYNYTVANTNNLYVISYLENKIIFLQYSFHHD